LWSSFSNSWSSCPCYCTPVAVSKLFHNELLYERQEFVEFTCPLTLPACIQFLFCNICFYSPANSMKQLEWETNKQQLHCFLDKSSMHDNLRVSIQPLLRKVYTTNHYIHHKNNRELTKSSLPISFHSSAIILNHAPSLTEYRIIHWQSHIAISSSFVGWFDDCW